MTKFTDKGYGVIIGEYAVLNEKGVGQKAVPLRFSI